MFSFVIWDKLKKAFIARDRIGKTVFIGLKMINSFAFKLNKYICDFWIIKKNIINPQSLFNFLVFNNDIVSDNFYYNGISKF